VRYEEVVPDPMTSLDEFVPFSRRLRMLWMPTKKL